MTVASPEKPTFITYSIRMDGPTNDALERLAEEDLCPKAVLIRRAIRDFIKARTGTDGND